ncbi:sensor histidine kinase [Pelomonas sp. KK5]|uniref:sensor histidine kinase n=1 Tax=Pelomonas sp. KK5 TaxID=1855730 RepID=UPI00097CAB96|nr:histidine kinase dimerization/phosphoacceptor domain -containing protein [Pelomonas sp. KK5]
MFPAATETHLLAAALDSLIDAELPIGLAVLDRQMRYVRINPVLAAANGLPREAHLGRSVREVLPLAAGDLEPLVRRVLDGEPLRGLRLAVEVPSLPGVNSDWEADYLPVRGGDGSVIGMTGFAVNRSLQAHNEQLRREAEHLRRLLDCSFVYVGLLTLDGRLIEANLAPLQAAQLDLAQVQGVPIWDTHWWSHSAELQAWQRDIIPRVAAGERVVRCDVEVRMAGDARAMIDYMLAPMRDEQGRIVCLVASAVDISEEQQRAARREIEAALGEKTALLGEVHHRVKNNLQVISSLLNLQAGSAEPAVRAALRDSQSRVRSMALMHQLLYERQDLSGLELGHYLRQLSGLLRETYLAGGSALQLVADAPERGLRIDMQRAIPCGLLVTELLTNSIKHAYPAGGPGRIELRVSDAGAGRASVDVSDDGIGMPQAGPATRGLGLQLLPLLTDQCRARLERLPAAAGTHYRLHLDLAPDAC